MHDCQLIVYLQHLDKGQCRAVGIEIISIEFVNFLGNLENVDKTDTLQEFHGQGTHQLLDPPAFSNALAQWTRDLQWSWASVHELVVTECALVWQASLCSSEI